MLNSRQSSKKWSPIVYRCMKREKSLLTIYFYIAISTQLLQFFLKFLGIKWVMLGTISEQERSFKADQDRMEHSTSSHMVVCLEREKQEMFKKTKELSLEDQVRLHFVDIFLV